MALPDTDLTVAWIVAERIRKAFEKERFLVGTGDMVQKTFFRTLSIGVAAYEDGATLLEFIQRADVAMYRAKSGGKNRSVKYTGKTDE